MYTRKTLRKMPKQTRIIGKLLNDLELTHRRLKAKMPEIERMESDSRALLKRQEVYPEPEPSQEYKDLYEDG